MNNIKNEIEYATALKGTIDDFINKNLKLRRNYNFKVESLVFIEDTDISGNIISKPITTFFNKYL
jgi:hypothetical protein